MTNLTSKEKKSILICIIFLIASFIIIEIYNSLHYKIDISTFSENGLLNYKNLETTNSYTISNFMKYVSEEKYQEAFNLLDETNRNSTFNNDIEEFKSKLKPFYNLYNELQYSTIFSREFNAYIDEEIICMICNSDNEMEHGVRFNIRTYKDNKAAKIIILSIN